MSKPKIGIIVSRDGVTSVALLADNERDRQRALKLYRAIEEQVAALEQGVRRCLRTGDKDGPKRPGDNGKCLN